MQELEPTWGRMLAVWWLIFWRSLIGSFVVGAVIGFVFGFIGRLLGVSQTVHQILPILGGLAGLCWSFLVIRMALRKRYGDFRIALVPLEAPPVRIPPRI